MSINITTEKLTYYAGDDLHINIDFTSKKNLLEHLTNININIYRVDTKRNEFVFGFGHNPSPVENSVQIQRSLPDNFVEGLYYINGLKLLYGENNEKETFLAPGKDLPETFFWYSDNKEFVADEFFVKNQINQIFTDRNNFINAEIIHPHYLTGAPDTESQNFKVLIFGVGCLVHSPQNMKGYTIYPLGTGYNYSHMREAVNSFLKPKYNFHLDNVESIEQSFTHSTPLFVIEFHNVKAPSHVDAAGHCTSFSENIFTILAYDRGQRPKQFASVIILHSTGKIWQAFHFPGYRGNLISDFSPSSTAETIESILPKIEASPWAELLMKSYADAKTEINPCVSCLKFWAILEMIAKKKVISNNIDLYYPNGNTIEDNGGNVVKTNSALGKVYKHVFDSNIPPSNITHGDENKHYIFETYQDAKANPNFNSQTELITLWETLSGLYEIRNNTAHAGEFNSETANNSGKARQVLAAKLWDIPYQTFLSQVSNMVQSIVANELASI